AFDFLTAAAIKSTAQTLAVAIAEIHGGAPPPIVPQENRTITFAAFFRLIIHGAQYNPGCQSQHGYGVNKIGKYPSEGCQNGPECDAVHPFFQFFVIHMINPCVDWRTVK